MRRATYVIVFILILLVACAGAFFAGRYLYDRLRQDFQPAQDWAPPAPTVSPVALASATASPAPRPTRTRPVIVTPVAPTQVPFTALPTGLPTPGALPVTIVPSPSVSLPIGSPFPGPTPTPAPTFESSGAFAFTLARPLRHSAGDCPGNYVLGSVVDARGEPLAGIRLALVDEFGNADAKITKGTAGDVGKYDFPIFGVPRRFYLSVVDAQGNALSARVEIPHGLGEISNDSCHWVDWQSR